MNNHKQEVIEKIVGALCHVWIKGYDGYNCKDLEGNSYSDKARKEDAEILYNCIAPLFEREFPEASYYKIFNDYLKWHITIDGLYMRLKRLWEGGHIAGGKREFPEEIIQKILYDYGRTSINRYVGGDTGLLPPIKNYLADIKYLWEGGHIADKKICQTCGGSGERKAKGAPTIKCSACEGTGEDRRSGDERRKHSEQVAMLTDNTSKRSQRIFMRMRGYWRLDRRTLEERRSQ